MPGGARFTSRGPRGKRVDVELARWRNDIISAVFTGVRRSVEKAHQSAVEDAPVRAVFKKGSFRRTRGGRARFMTLPEANSEDAIRRRLGLARAAMGLTRTGGRPAPTSANNPYLRRAATRRGNPNSFAPFLIERGTSKADIAEARKILEETRERGFGRSQDLGLEIEPPVRGGRELTRGGRLRYRPAVSRLDARGRYDLRTGRANFTDPKTGVTTLGGRLRKEIKPVMPTLQGNIIRGGVVSPTSYAQYQEFGTRHNRATPYMRPAILKLTTSYRAEIVKAINQANR